MSAMAKIACAECGAEFVPSNNRQKYCSRECKLAVKARNRREDYEARKNHGGGVKATKVRQTCKSYKQITSAENRKRVRVATIAELINSTDALKVKRDKDGHRTENRGRVCGTFGMSHGFRIFGY